MKAVGSSTVYQITANRRVIDAHWNFFTSMVRVLDHFHGNMVKLPNTKYGVVEMISRVLRSRRGILRRAFPLDTWGCGTVSASYDSSLREHTITNRRAEATG